MLELFIRNDLLCAEFSNLSLSLNIKGAQYDATACVGRFNVLSLNTKTSLRDILKKRGDKNLVEVSILGMLPKRREVSKNVQKFDLKLAPIDISVNRAIIVGIFNFVNEVKSYALVSPQSMECAAPQQSNEIVKYCISSLSLSKMSISLRYSDEHIKGDGFENIVGREAKLLLRYLGPLISKLCDIDLPSFEDSVYFQNVGQIAKYIGEYYLKELVKFWKKK